MVGKHGENHGGRKALDTFKQRIRKISKRVGGKSMKLVAEPMPEYLPEWKAYFSLAQTPQTFKDLGSWTQHRLRAIQLKQWRTGTTAYRRLCRSRGNPRVGGSNTRGY